MDPERAALVWVWLIILWEVSVNRLGKWVLGVLVLIVLVQGISIYRLRRGLYDEQLATRNERARHATTKARFAGQVLILERLVVQKDVELTAALRQRGQRDNALVQIEMKAKTVRDTTPAVVAVGEVQKTVTIVADFDARDSLGILVHSETTLQGFRLSGTEPPGALIGWDIRREPLGLAVALSCRGNDAVAQVAGPRWATFDFVRVEQRPELCSPPPPAWRPFAIEAPSLPVSVALVAAGWILRDLLTAR